MDKPIGIFDSGVGGLTVLESLKKQLPNEKLIYIGDNKNCPYGDKTKEQLLMYTKEICEYFITQDVKMIVLACNTTSANVLNELQALYPQIPIVGVIHSTVHDFLAKEKRAVLIIATHATIQSHKYEQLIHEYDQNIMTYELETPLLVPLIENGEYKKGIYDVLNDYLLKYKEQIDSMILGCTHYPIILKQIENVLGEKEYISSSAAICHEVYSYLKVHHMFRNQTEKPFIKIYTTGNIDDFVYSSEDFFDYEGLEVKHLEL